MCQMKSGIILKDRIFIPDYDSHTDMLAELGISDTRQNAERLFIRAELLPPDGDVFAPVEEWSFHVDQDILPDWYVEQVDKDRMVAAVKKWAKDRVHVGVDNLRISQGSNHYIKDCKDVVVCGSASISCVCGSASISCVCGSASISEVYGSASISRVYGSASIGEVCGSASISNVYDSASISRVCDSASIGEVYGSASIGKVYGSASIGETKGQAFIANSPYTRWEKQDALIISENATFKDNINKIILQAGNWVFKKVGERNADN